MIDLLTTQAHAQAGKPLVTPEQFAAVIAEMAKRKKVIDEDSEQYQMLEAFLLRGIPLVSGAAGSGKTAIVGEAVAIAAALTGHDMVGTTLSAAAAALLGRETKMQALNTAQLLHRIETGQLEIKPGSWCLVDECSQGSTGALTELAEVVSAKGGLLFLSGDWRQLTSPEAGGMYLYLYKYHPEIATTAFELRRQRDHLHRVMLQVMHDQGNLSKGSREALIRQASAAEEKDPGRYAGTADAVEALIHRFTGGQDEKGRNELSREQAYRELVEWVIEQGMVTPHKTLTEAAKAIGQAHLALSKAGHSVAVSTGTNEWVKTLNHEIREAYIADGQLDRAKEFTFGGARFIPGEVMEARENDYNIGILNSDRFRPIKVRRMAVEHVLELKVPGGTKRMTFEGVAVPKTVTLSLSAKQVAQERARAQAWVERAQEIHAGSKQMGAQLRWHYKVLQAQKKLEWANSLPDDGIKDLELKVGSHKVAETVRIMKVAGKGVKVGKKNMVERLLEVELINDDGSAGEKRYLTKDYVSHSGGFSATSTARPGRIPLRRPTDASRVHRMLTAPGRDPRECRGERRGPGRLPRRGAPEAHRSRCASGRSGSARPGRPGARGGCGSRSREPPGERRGQGHDGRRAGLSAQGNGPGSRQGVHRCP